MAEINPIALLKLEQPATPSVPVIISETSGSGRVITLRGRSLPYRGVAFPSTLRTSKTYYPGNPVADANVLGATWDDTTMEGKWCDTHLFRDDSRVLLLGFPRIVADDEQISGTTFATGGAVGEQEARRARVVRDAFYSVQRAGQLLKVEWGSIVRFGFLLQFTPTHDRDSDISWSMEWEWLSDTAAQPRYKQRPRLDPFALATQFVQRAQSVIDQLKAALVIIRGSRQVLTQAITKLTTAVTDVTDTLGAIITESFVPLAVWGTIRQSLAAVQLSALGVLAAVRANNATFAALATGASPSEANISASVAAAIAANAAKLGLDASDTLNEMDLLVQPDTLGTVTIVSGQTLRDVAREAYGDPASWTLIANANGIVTSRPPAGTVVSVPNPNQAGGPIGGGG